MGVLKDFIQFDVEFWKIFDCFERAGFKVSCFEAASMSASKQNLENRLATVLTAMIQVEGVEWLNDVLYKGSMKAIYKAREWGYDISPVAPMLAIVN